MEDPLRRAPEQQRRDGQLQGPDRPRRRYPSGSQASAWELTIARWITPLPADNAASSTRPGRLNVHAITIPLISAGRSPGR